MLLTLLPHSDTPQPAVSAFTCEVARSAADRLELRYQLAGDLAALTIPAPTAPERVDELWRHTCFEVFVRAPGRPNYREFNFAPSSRWAAYSFDAYRAGMRPAPSNPPQIEVLREEGWLTLLASIEGLTPEVWHLAISAVLEAKGGTRSYWALAHPPGAPDFHHPDCFRLELPPPPAP